MTCIKGEFFYFKLCGVELRILLPCQTQILVAIEAPQAQYEASLTQACNLVRNLHDFQRAIHGSAVYPGALFRIGVRFSRLQSVGKCRASLHRCGVVAK